MFDCLLLPVSLSLFGPAEPVFVFACSFSFVPTCDLSVFDVESSSAEIGGIRGSSEPLSYLLVTPSLQPSNCIDAN